MKYEFIYNEDQLLTYQPYVESKAPVYTTQSIIIDTIEGFVSFCDSKGIDYSILIDSGLVTDDLPTNPDLIIDLSEKDGNTRKAYIVTLPIIFGNLTKKATLRIVVKTFDNQGVLVDSRSYTRYVLPTDTITVDNQEVNEFDVLYESMKTQGLITTIKNVILSNDANGVYD